MNNKLVNNKPQKIKHPTILGTLISAALKIIFTSLVAWFALIAWFLGQSLVKSPNIALERAEKIVNGNLQFITASPTAMTQKLAELFTSLHQSFLNIVNQLSTRFEFIQSALHLLLAATEISISRLFIYLLAIPFFGLILAVFFTDGLVKRDIRKFQGSRESTFTFHRAKHFFGFCFFVPFFVFLCCPLAITPILFLVAQALLMGMAAKLSATYFKKYV